jgi:hypothetical protein
MDEIRTDTIMMPSILRRFYPGTQGESRKPGEGSLTVDRREVGALQWKFSTSIRSLRAWSSTELRSHR